MSRSHRQPRFEEVNSDEEVDTPTMRPESYTYHNDDSDTEIQVNRVRREDSPRRRGAQRRTRGAESLVDSFFGDDDFFGGGFGRSSRRSGGSRSLVSSFFDDDDFFGGGFGGIGSMMQDFGRMHQRMDALMSDASRSMRRSGGSGGTYYTSTRRIVSNNGVVEETAQEEDSSGRKKIRVRRQIGDKGSLVEKELTADGTETTTKRLHNLREEEEPAFEREWENTTGSRSAFRGLGFAGADRDRSHQPRALRHRS